MEFHGWYRGKGLGSKFHGITEPIKYSNLSVEPQLQSDDFSDLESEFDTIEQEYTLCYKNFGENIINETATYMANTSLSFHSAGMSAINSQPKYNYNQNFVRASYIYLGFEEKVNYNGEFKGRPIKGESVYYDKPFKPGFMAVLSNYLFLV